MANPEHLARIKQDVEVWNAWRVQQPEVCPDLSEADLSGAHLRKVDFSKTNLSKANLTGAKLSTLDFTGHLYDSMSPARLDLHTTKDRNDASTFTPDLSGANLSDANLSGANLSGAELSGANLSRANLSRAILAKTMLIGADLSAANLHKADLSKAYLAENIHLRADNWRYYLANPSAALDFVEWHWEHFKAATLCKADLTEANLRGARVFGADLSETDLRRCQGLRLDFNFIRNAKLSPNAKDPWSILRRNYTGSRLLFHLLLLIAFIAPYVARTMMWVSVNRSQTAIMEITKRLEDAAAQTQERGDHHTFPPSQVAMELSKITPCLAPKCKTLTVGEALLGVDKGWKYWSLAAALLLYNLCRAILTRLVGPLRDEEERSGNTPALGSYGPWSEGYLRLIPLHWVVQALFWVSVISIAWHGWQWLTTPVWLPS